MQKYNANTEDVVISKDTIWFFSSDYNALFKKKIGNKDVEFIGSVHWEKQNGVRLYSTIELFENKLYLIPCSAKCIAVYDICKNIFTKIEIQKDKERQSTSYMAAVIYKHYLFMFGFKSACIIRIDLISNDIKYLDGWYEKISKDILDYNAPFFRKQVAIVNSNAYIPFWNANYLLQLNLDTLEFYTYQLGLEKRGYAGICYFEDKLFCIPTSKGEDIVSFKCENDKVFLETKELINTFPNKEPIHFVGIVEENNSLMAYTLNDKTGEVVINRKIKFYYGNYCFVSDNNQYKCVYNKNSAKLTVFIKGTKEIVTEYLYIDYLYWRMFASKANVINIEEEGIDLDNYLRCLYLTNIKETKKEQNIGNMIYSVIKNTI